MEQNGHWCGIGRSGRRGRSADPATVPLCGGVSSAARTDGRDDAQVDGPSQTSTTAAGGVEAAGEDRRPGPLDQPQEPGHVVEREQPAAGRLGHLQQVAQVAPGTSGRRPGRRRPGRAAPGRGRSGRCGGSAGRRR